MTCVGLKDGLTRVMEAPATLTQPTRVDGSLPCGLSPLGNLCGFPLTSIP